MQLKDAIESLLLATRADGLSDNTVKGYRRKLRPLTEFLGQDTDIATVTIEDLRRYVVSLKDRDTRWEDHPNLEPQPGGLSPHTIASHVRALKRLFNFLEAEGVLEHNPTRRLKTPVPKVTTPKALDLDDLQALLSTTTGDRPADIRDRAIILLLADSGCRVAGLCGLRPEDLDLQGGVARVVEKGNKARAVMFTKATAEALSAWLAIRPSDKGPTVFTSMGPKNDAGLSTGGVGEMLKRRAKRAGVVGRVNPHAFRHAFAREYLLNGGDLATLADLMGHEGVEITKAFYSQFTLKELKEKHTKHSMITKLLKEDPNANTS